LDVRESSDFIDYGGRMSKVDTVGLFEGKFRGFMEVSSGKKVNPFNMYEDDIDIKDIAHALSLICRYGGHCKKFYSVAEHSIRVAENVDQKYKLAALLHDAAEAYIGDNIRPVKYNIPVLQSVEDEILPIIMSRFSVKWDKRTMEVVREADNIVGATEGRDLMYHVEDWGNLPEPLKDKIIPLELPYSVERFFITKFLDYGGSNV